MSVKQKDRFLIMKFLPRTHHRLPNVPYFHQAYIFLLVPIDRFTVSKFKGKPPSFIQAQ